MSVSLARPEIAALKPYVTALQQAGALRLNANEAPRSPLDDGLNRYPGIRPALLEEQLASLFGVSIDKLLVTRGSSEAIDLLTRTFCRAYQDDVLVLPPTFSMYQVYARMQGAEVIEVPLDPAADFALDVDRISASCTDHTKLIYVCSPNNPTGGSVPVADIERLLQLRDRKSLIVVDEAYIEFSEYDSVAGLLDRFENLAVLRTLSKAWGLAGTRCGAVIANAPIIALLSRMLPPYAFSAAATQQVLQSLSEQGRRNARDVIATTLAERERMRQALAALPCVTRVWNSDSNFLLVQFVSLDRVQRRMADRNILIRAFGDSELLANCARITIGDVSENATLLDALAGIPGTTS